MIYVLLYLLYLDSCSWHLMTRNHNGVFQAGSFGVREDQFFQKASSVGWPEALEKDTSLVKSHEFSSGFPMIFHGFSVVFPWLFAACSGSLWSSIWTSKLVRSDQKLLDTQREFASAFSSLFGKVWQWQIVCSTSIVCLATYPPHTSKIVTQFRLAARPLQASELARVLGLPRIYVSCNSGLEPWGSGSLSDSGRFCPTKMAISMVNMTKYVWWFTLRFEFFPKNHVKTGSRMEYTSLQIQIGGSIR